MNILFACFPNRWDASYGYGAQAKETAQTSPSRIRRRIRITVKAWNRWLAERVTSLFGKSHQRSARGLSRQHTRRTTRLKPLFTVFFRGTGIRGLVGIPPARQLISGVSLIRPFLGCRKSSLLRYLEERGLEYRTDSSNQTDQFTRNRIRAELLPLVNTIFENDPSSSVLSIAEQSSEFIHWIDSQMDRLIEDYVVLDSNSVQIQMDPSITSLPTIVVNELWIRIWIEMGWPRQQMSRDKWNALSHLTNKVHLTKHATEQKKISLPGHLLAERLSDHLVIWDASEDPN